MLLPIRFLTIAWAPLVLLSGCGLFSLPEPEAAKAVKSAEAITDGLLAGRSRAVWDGLSDSHQEEVNRLVHRLAEKLPPSTWGNGSHLVELWGRLLKEKREFALNSPALEQGHAYLEQHGEAMAAFFTKLSQSDFKDLEKLKTADVGDLLAQIDPEFLNAIPALLDASANAGSGLSREQYESALNSLSSASFSLGPYEADRATVHVAYDKGQVAGIEFVKSSGRWVMQVPEGDWNEAMTAANEWLDGLDAERLKSFSLWESVISAAVSAQLEDVLKTQTQAEFDQILADPSYAMVKTFFFATPEAFLRGPI